MKRPLTQFAAVIVLGLFVVGGGAIWASQRAGHREALNEARSLTEQSARSLILPNLNQAVLDGDADALDVLDSAIRDHLLGDRVLRVKLWLADGTVVYSDADELIGERYKVAPDRLAAVERAVTVADLGDLDGRESRFDIALGPLLEVYLPIEGPNGERMLFEAYFDANSVNRSASRIRSTVVPITLVSLFLMGALTLAMARRLSKRMDRVRAERESLQARAIDASAYERRRIAADLHDGVIQDLAGTAMLLSSAESATNGNPVLNARLAATSDALRHSLTSLRGLAIEIHPPNLAAMDFTLALEGLLEQTRVRYGVETTLEQHSEISIDDTDHKRLVYRFVLEGLRNVAKHAKASSVKLAVRGDIDDRVLVT
ncbi:MAG: hypothetical protein GXP35_16560, partial [Actinobacteria bacterium]|nr:hypothetical protein [Actinomycetota bacterium]